MISNLFSADAIWSESIDHIIKNGNISNPRGMRIKEIIGYSLNPIDMNYPIIFNTNRKMNYSFMFAEANWIVSGQNIVSPLTKYLKKYANYSDDGIFMRGAYGPKFIEQLPWVIETLNNDKDTRQAVISIWRERPGASKDIPCTLTLQFLIRDNKLHTVVNMRSQDMVWGFCYDVFSFTMMTLAVKICLSEVYNINLSLGNLYMRYGSAHIYEHHWNEVETWISNNNINPKAIDISNSFMNIISAKTYEELCNKLSTSFTNNENTRFI